MGVRREETFAAKNFAAERDEGVPQAMLLTFGTPHFGKPHSCRPDQTGRVKDGAAAGLLSLSTSLCVLSASSTLSVHEPSGVVRALFGAVGRCRDTVRPCWALSVRCPTLFGVVRILFGTVSALSVRCPALPVCCPGLCRNRLLRQSLRAVLLPGLFFRGRLCRFPDRFSDGYFQGTVLADI